MKAGTLPVVVSVTIPPGEYRTPRVVAVVRCGAITLRLTVRRLSGARLDVLAPHAMDGLPGVEMAAPLWAAVQEAALEAVAIDADAVAALLSGRRKRHRLRHAAPGERDDFDGEP
jgi:hypothetical protein